VLCAVALCCALLHCAVRCCTKQLLTRHTNTHAPSHQVTDVGCLNTVIPPPLNWGPLWCAGKEAKVMQWYDEIGTLHRHIDIPVQPNVTSNMVFWLFSPMYPQFLEYAGQNWFWYHLWHPLDHIMVRFFWGGIWGLGVVVWVDAGVVCSQDAWAACSLLRALRLPYPARGLDCSNELSAVDHHTNPDLASPPHLAPPHPRPPKPTHPPQAANTVAPSSVNFVMPGLYTLIHEHYRNTAPEKARNLPEFETDCWFHIEDMMSNFLKKRIVISINTAGLQAWTLVVNLKDTPEGLKIDNELIIGAAPVGYDKTDPEKGAPLEAGQIVNDNLIKPALETYTPGEDFIRSCNAITRHVVEEFSMFRFFLPTVWARYPQLQTLSNFGMGVQDNIPKLNYGPGMVGKSFNTAGLTTMMAPLNRTALKNTTQLKEALGKVPEAIKEGLAANLNASVQATVKDLNKVITAINNYPANSKNATHTIVSVHVPSAAGAFSSDNKAFAAPKPAAAAPKGVRSMFG